MSIKRKLTFTMMGISVAAVVLTVAAIMSYLIYDMRRTGAQELEVTATLTGDRNSAALLFMDNEAVHKNLEIFRENPAILVACLYDAHGNLFASYQTEHDAMGMECITPLPPTPINHPDLLTATANIVKGGETLGRVFIASNTQAIDAFVHKILLISSATVAFVLAMTLALTIYFQRTLSAPILELTATAEAITQSRDYSLEARQSYTDETGTLARAFNAMLAEVRARDRELMLSNETLEQKVIERTHELEEAMHRAEAASAAKTEFLRNMSHEFRTPLHAIISFSSYGTREFESAERPQLKQYFDLMHTCAERLSKLVNEVLDLAKMEQGEHIFSLKRIDLREPLTAATDLIHPLAQEKNLTLALDLPPEPVLTVCDQDKIVQILTNLLGNAVKFTPQGKRITLALAQQQNELAISVIDEGIGIPEEEKELIFESFKQSSRTNTGAGGTGLGLAICRRIVEAHSGRIWAENNANGIGARITFTIPALLEEGTKRVTLHEMEG